MKNVLSILFQRAVSDKDWKYYHNKDSDEKRKRDRQQQEVGISMLITDYKKDFCPRKEGRVITSEVQQGRSSSKG